MASIEFRGVSKRFGATVALDNLSFRIEDGEAFCFFGPPLSGKTTLLRMILGVETPDSGEVLIGDRPVRDVRAAERNLAMVFQNLALFPHMTARQNLRFPLEERGTPAQEIDPRVDVVAETLHISHILHKHPGQLSGGERQRVAIGRSLVRDPAAFLMDDPISALDARLREEMRVELKRIQQDLGKTLVYVTHDQEEAMSIADRMAILRDGGIQQIGAPAEVYDNPRNQYVASMLGQPALNLIAVRSGPGGGALVSEDGLFRLDGAEPSTQMIGVRPESIVLGDVPHGSEPAHILTIEPLGGFTVVNVAAPVSDTTYRVLLRGQPKIEVGQAVGLQYPADAIMRFDGRGDKIGNDRRTQ